MMYLSKIFFEPRLPTLENYFILRNEVKIFLIMEIQKVTGSPTKRQRPLTERQKPPT